MLENCEKNHVFHTFSSQNHTTMMQKNVIYDFCPKITIQ